jgi:Cys-tRNA synthase (O-phospho-L-seryl-tRNA:Cys-tRNA synthase)
MLTDRQKRFLDVLRKTRGLVSYAVKATNGEKYFNEDSNEFESIEWTGKPISYKEHKKWQRENEDYNDVLEEIEEEKNDYIEMILLRVIGSGNASLLSNVSKVKLAKRGYGKVESDELDLSDIWVGFYKESGNED